jgi:hypothetical protein
VEVVKGETEADGGEEDMMLDLRSLGRGWIGKLDFVMLEFIYKRGSSEEVPFGTLALWSWALGCFTVL